MTNSTGMAVLGLIALAAGGFKLWRGDFTEEEGGGKAPLAFITELVPRSPEQKLADSLEELRAAETQLRQFQQVQNRVAPNSLIQVRTCNGTMKTVPVTNCRLTLNGSTLQQCQQDYALARQNYLKHRQALELAKRD